MDAFPTDLTVTDPAASKSLTRLDTVKAELGISGTAQDENLLRMIQEQSAVAVSSCNREFALETVEERFHLDGAVDALRLSRAPVADTDAIESVTVDGVEVDGGELEVVNPGPAASAKLYRLDAAGDRIPWCGRRIVVEYSGGYELLEDLPQDVERAVIELVKLRHFAAARDPLVKGEGLDGVMNQQFWVGGTPGSDGAIPPTVGTLLDKYTRAAVA